jgi:anti-sigma regulatory factor (Ser/Thr protein kinase)
MTPVARPPADRAERQAILALPDNATAPGKARKLLKDTLPSWGLLHLVDDAELAVSELVTNALRHGLPPVTLSLCKGGRSLRIEVSDMRPSTAHHELPVVSQDGDESGRGQGIVALVSDHTGLSEPHGPGKSVYAAWDLAAP